MPYKYRDLAPFISFQPSYPFLCVFLSACSLRLFDASISTGMVAIILRAANTHAIISMIFSSWHSVNPARIFPTPWRQRMMPHIEWMRTPDTIQRIVETSKNIYFCQCPFTKSILKWDLRNIPCETSNGRLFARNAIPCKRQTTQSFSRSKRSRSLGGISRSLKPKYGSFVDTGSCRWWRRARRSTKEHDTEEDP